MKQGDIFRWSWKDDKRPEHYPYRCLSQIVVVSSDGVLRDTYSSSHNKAWSEEEAAIQIDLVFLANFSDLDSVNPENRAYYDDDDCVDLSHSNARSGNFYIRKGAERSLVKMATVIKRLIRQYKSEAEYATRRLEDSERSLAELNIDSYVTNHKDVGLHDDN